MDIFRVSATDKVNLEQLIARDPSPRNYQRVDRDPLELGELGSIYGAQTLGYEYLETSRIGLNRQILCTASGHGNQGVKVPLR